jgi:hypothetical protein
VIVPAGQLLIRAANATTTYGTAPSYTVLSVNYMQDTNGTYTPAKTPALISAIR